MVQVHLEINSDKFSGWLFLHSPQHRWPVLIMLFGQFVGRTLFMLDRIYAIRFVPPLDLLGMAFEFLMYAIAFLGFRIFDPISLARQAAIAQMREGMLVGTDWTLILHSKSSIT